MKRIAIHLDISPKRWFPILSESRVPRVLKTMQFSLVAVLACAFSIASVPAEAIQQGSPGERVEVTLVLLDVVVTDRKGVPITGIAPGEFELIVDNTRVPIDRVEEQCTEPAVEGGVAKAVRDEPRHFIVLFDMSHMMAGSRRDAIRATMQFVEEGMADSDRVMVLAFLRGLYVISNFTSDRVALKEKLEALLVDQSLIDTSAFEEEIALARLAKERFSTFFTSDDRFRVMRTDALAMSAECRALGREAEIETARSMRTFSNLMPAFGGLPGRKALVLFTETLRASPATPYLDACAVPQNERFESELFSIPEIDGLIERANLAGISVYSVHAGGMFSGPGRTTSAVHSARDFQTTVAISTSGKNFVLMNDRVAPFSQAARDISCHYELAYKPSDPLEVGRHTVLVRVAGKKRQVRHRTLFVVQSPDEARETEMMAVLSSPGLYKDLPITVHGYSLGPADRDRRRFLLKASVPLSDLVLLPSGDGQLRGSLSVRGVLLADEKIQCDFTRTVPIDLPMEDPPGDGSVSRAGIEASCELEPGEHEIVLVARDETGGALGAFWARTQIEAPRDHDGNATLLWGPRGDDIWSRDPAEPPLPDAGPEPLFVKEDFTIPADRAGAITFIACSGKGDEGSPEPATVALSGPASATLPARPVETRQREDCFLMEARVPAGSLEPGRYEIQPRPAAGWTVPGKPVAITVDGDNRLR